MVYNVLEEELHERVIERYATTKREGETHKGRKSRKARTLAGLPLQCIRAPAPVLTCCNK
jgi:hypothetical protein